MAEGNNQIIVTASDAAGNVSNSVTATIVVATKHTITAQPVAMEAYRIQEQLQ